MLPMKLLEGKKCVVTGGAGFVGSHLTDALLDLGAHVTVVDTLVEGKREYIHAEADVAEIDVRDTEALRAVIEGAEYVFHLAALASVPGSIENPALYHDVNVNGTLSVLEAIRTLHAKARVIFASSASVYGDQETVPVHENCPPCPMSPYALHKLMGEQYVRLYSVLYGVHAVSLRPFNIYGTRMNPNGPYASVIGKFLQMRTEGKPLCITGDGTQTRDFVHVSDVVRAYILAATSTRVGKGETINIASGQGATINDIAKLIGGEISYIPARVELRNSVADVSLAKKLLDWEPEISLKDGLDELQTITKS